MMDTNAWAILARLLEMASGEFSNHGCNDLNLPNTPENYNLIKAADKYCRGYAEEPSHASRDNQFIASDFELMLYFAHLARELAGIEE